MKKKRIIISSLALLLAGACLVSCDPNEDNPNDDIGGETLKYTITFVNEDGTEINKIELNSGATITAPTSPTKEGYTFVGWDYNSDGTADALGTATENRTYKAIFVENEVETYNVTFKADGVVVDTLAYTQANPSVTAPAVPTKEGYTGAWEEYTLTTGDKEVNAVYTLIEYKVTFKADETIVGTDTYTVEDKVITVPEVPTKEGYTGAWEEYTLTTGDKEVKAVYTLNCAPEALGKYIFTDENDAKSILEVTSSGITYTKGTEVYTAFTMDSDNNITMTLANAETITFTFNTETIRYSVGDDTFYKTIPTEWHGVYFSNAGGLLTVTETGATYVRSSNEYKNPIVTATGLAFDNDTFVYTKNSTATSFVGVSATLKFINPMEKSKLIEEKWYGTWIASNGDSVTFAQRSASYTKAGVTYSDYFVYKWDSQYSKGISTIIFENCFLTIYADETSFSSNDGRSLVAKFGKEIVTDIPEEYAYRTFTAEDKDTWGDTYTLELKIIDSKLTYTVPGAWSTANYDVYSINNGVITIFKSNYYAESNILATFEFVDGKLIRTMNNVTKEFTEKDVALDEIAGDYQAQDGGIISITSEDITYLGTTYGIDDIAISSNTITVGGHVLKFTNALFVGNTKYVKVNHINLDSTYGTYKCGLKELSISATGLVYDGTTYQLSDVKVFGNDVTFGDSIKLTYDENSYTIGLDTYEKIDSMYGTYRVGTDNSKVVVLSADSLEFNGAVYAMGDVAYASGVFTFGAEMQLSFADGGFDAEGEKYVKVTNIELSSIYGTYRYNNDNKDLIIISETGISYAGIKYNLADIKIISNDILFGDITLTYANNTITIVEKEYSKVSSIELSEAYGTYMNGNELIIISSEGVVYKNNTFDIADVKIIGNDILFGENTIVYSSGEITEGQKIYAEISQFYALYKDAAGDSIRFSAAGIEFGGQVFPLNDISVNGNEITFNNIIVTFVDKTATIDDVAYNLYLEINSNVLGTYLFSSYGYTLTLSDGSIELKGVYRYEVISYNSATNEIKFMIQTSSYYPARQATFTYDAETKVYTWAENFYDFEFQDPLKPYYGKYNDDTYELVINEDGVSMTYGEATAESYEVAANGGIVVTMTNGDILTLSYTESGYSFTLEGETVTLPKFVYKIQSAWVGSWTTNVFPINSFTITDDLIMPSEYLQEYYNYSYEVLNENQFMITYSDSFETLSIIFTYDAVSNTFNAIDQWGYPGTATKVE